MKKKVIEFVSKKLASGKRIHELEMLKRLLKYRHGLLASLKESLYENYNCSMDNNCVENVVNMMTNEFPTSAAKKTYSQCVFLKKKVQITECLRRLKKCCEIKSSVIF